MATSEIDGAHGLPRYIHTCTDEIQQVLHGVGGERTSNGIKLSSAQRYARRLIQRVNRNEEGVEGQKQRMRTGMVKVLGLSNKTAKKSDPGLPGLCPKTSIACIMISITNKKEMLLCYSQEFLNTKKPTE